MKKLIYLRAEFPKWNIPPDGLDYSIIAINKLNDKESKQTVPGQSALQSDLGLFCLHILFLSV